MLMFITEEDRGRMRAVVSDAEIWLEACLNAFQCMRDGVPTHRQWPGGWLRRVVVKLSLPILCRI